MEVMTELKHPQAEALPSNPNAIEMASTAILQVFLIEIITIPPYS
jgi:hypothetical protein